MFYPSLIGRGFLFFILMGTVFFGWFNTRVNGNNRAQEIIAGKEGITVKKFIIRCGIVLFLGMAFFTALALVPLEDPEPCSLQNSVLRFHVIADSNNPRDQQLKLMVRDAVLEYLRPELSGAQDQAVASRLIQKKLPQIQEIATATLRDAGCADKVQVFLGTFDFPARAYGQVTLPAGSYRALRIVLGKGEGKNWWCCLFPPLCYVDLTRSGRELAEHDLLLQAQLDRAGLAEDVAVLNKGKEKVRPHLTTKIGELLDNSKPPALLSWIRTRAT